MDKFPILSVAVAKEVLSIVNEISGDVQEVVASHAGVFRGAGFSSPPKKRPLNRK